MKYFIFILCFFKSSLLQAPSQENFWVIWNVGQGQWVTYVTTDSCQHFDFGGERFQQRNLLPLFKKFCQNKLNRLHLSHADTDHYSFYPLILKNTRKVCWSYKPLENLKMIQDKSGYCPPPVNNDLKPTANLKVLHLNYKDKNRNATSTVIESQRILIPGDSTQNEEKKWLHNLNPQNNIRILILGHHGSKTSTSKELLKQLPHLKMAIASQRTKKYGHPHKDVRKKLHDFKIPLLLTESWGTIRLE